jgi:hypothetical protein
MAHAVEAGKEIGVMKWTSGKGTTVGQKGASAVGTVILLAIAAYGVFVGIQCVPQLIESGTVDSILTSIEHDHRTEPVRSTQALRTRVDSLLNVNQLDQLKDSFEVREWAGDYVIEVSYERELNLLFDTRTIKYEDSVTLH